MQVEILDTYRQTLYRLLGEQVGAVAKVREWEHTPRIVHGV